MKYLPWISAVILAGCAHQSSTESLPSMTQLPTGARPQIRPIVGNQENKAVAPTNKDYLIEELNYTKLIDAYDRNDHARFEQQLKKITPKSLYYDRALYVHGMFALSNKDHSTALTQFNKILKSYPHSSLAPSALYAKGITLKRMSWTEGARQNLMAVVKQYPGSPEAERAQTEIKLIDMGVTL